MVGHWEALWNKDCLYQALTCVPSPQMYCTPTMYTEFQVLEKDVMGQLHCLA